MQNTKEAREARRRKILERGADRIALITGERKLVSPPPTSASFISEIEDEPSVAVTSMNGSLPESIEDNSKSTSSVAELELNRESSTVIGPDSSSLGCQAGDKKKFPSTVFTVNRFSRAINVSENARVFCAVGIAIFLVFQSVVLKINHPFVTFLDQFLPSRPVFLIISTDMTLVIATMLAISKNTNPIGAINHFSEETSPASGAWKLANTVGNVLQTFFILKKVASAVLIDVSIYFVVLVCGLSLGKYWS